MPKGLLNPKNAVESSGGGFKEGNVRIESSTFKVHKSQVSQGGQERQAVLALAWNVTRLDDELDAVTNDDGEEVKEDIIFSLGGKSLASAHPGNANSPDDEEPEDAGVEVSTEGPTIFLSNQDFKLNKKSACAQLMESLKQAGFKEEILDRVWAPDFVGYTFHMKTFVTADMMKGDDGKERPLTYKVVDKIIATPKKGKGESKTEAKGESKNAEAEKVLLPILRKFSEELDGTRMTRKALTTKIMTYMQDPKHKTEPKLHVPVISLVKDDKWLFSHAGEFDIKFDADENLVTFGELKEEE